MSLYNNIVQGLNEAIDFETGCGGARTESCNVGLEIQVAKALRDARHKIGLTQFELAEITGIAQSDISKIELGKANPCLGTLKRLAEGLNMNMRIQFVPKKQES